MVMLLKLHAEKFRIMSVPGWNSPSRTPAADMGSPILSKSGLDSKDLFSSQEILALASRIFLCGSFLVHSHRKLGKVERDSHSAILGLSSLSFAPLDGITIL